MVAETEYKVRTVATRCLVTPGTVNYWIGSGRLEATRMPSGQWRITEAALQKFLHTPPTPNRPPPPAPRKKSK